MIDNIVIPVLNRSDVVIDNERIEAGLTLQKYFPYKLIEWEVFLFALIVGVLQSDGDIFFNDIRILVGRGSGKNGFISFLCFYFLSPYHGISGYNIDLIANAEQQAKTSFNDVFGVVKTPSDPANAKALADNYHPTREEITGKVTGSILRYNTSSKRGKDSKRTGCIIYDEKHEYLDFTNINALKSGLGKVWHGREITISTDGHVRGAVLDKEKDQNRAILEAYNPDNRTLVFWCRIEAEEEWNQIDKLVKAIPSLNSDLSNFKSLRSTIQKEITDMPFNMDYYPEFLAKRCNYPVGDRSVVVAVYDDLNAAASQEVPDLTGMTCVGGLDYSRTDDFTACVLLFFVNGKHYLLQHTFVCRRSKDLRGIKAPLSDWEKSGELEFVDDVEIPACLIANWFENMGKKYNIQRIAVDRYRYSYVSAELRKVGFDAMTDNLYLLKKGDNARVSVLINSMFLNHNIVWGGAPHPLMNWYTNNVQKSFNGTSIYFEKIEPDLRKTDGFMAFVAAMAIAEDLPDGAPFEIPDIGLITW